MIRAFHGSPGLPEDFVPLKEALGGLPLQAFPRAGYPNASQGDSETARSAGQPLLYLGYSFGCVDAVISASQSDSARGVILIAPYLFPERSPGALKKLLISLPGIGNALLEKTGPKAIQELVDRSSAPAKPSVQYQKTAAGYCDPAILRRSILEKEGRAESVQSSLKSLRERKLPILAIYGDSDVTISETSQLDPLRKSAPGLREVRLESAGHALLWTHSQRLADEIKIFSDTLNTGAKV